MAIYILAIRFLSPFRHNKVCGLCSHLSVLAVSHSVVDKGGNIIICRGSKDYAGGSSLPQAICDDHGHLARQPGRLGQIVCHKDGSGRSLFQQGAQVVKQVAARGRIQC